MNKYKEALKHMTGHISALHWIYEHEICVEQYEKDKSILQELVEKATPKKPIGDLHSVPHYRCPICHGGVKMYEDSIVYPFCHHCGQKLDWK